MRTGKTLEVLDKIYKAICEQKSVGVINSTGTMELIPIVRCKDCKHRSEKMYDYCNNPNDKRYVCQINDLAKNRTGSALMRKGGEVE